MKVFSAESPVFFFFLESHFKGTLHDLGGSPRGCDRQFPAESTITTRRNTEYCRTERDGSWLISAYIPLLPLSLTPTNKHTVA